LSLSPGTRLGTYEIGALIGAGGMGEVYRARDTTLDRLVAIKVLPKSLAGDPDRIARFEREARTLAALNHPHIAHIHGFEASGGVLALVMELVEGPTLEDRIAQGQLPLDEALAIARQVADALNAAHEQGIVHRDLKPANIKLRPDGAVKVLDFGLAKTLDPVSGASPGVTATPTITTPAQMTAIGTVLGTAAYMSPEQAKGLAADRRSDVWGFGCVVYEMLSGRRPFAGDGVADMLAAILRAEPDWSRLPAGTPEGIRRLLERCLRKDCRLRLHSLADARIEIDDSQHAPLAKPLAAPRYQAWLPWTVVALTVLAAFAEWAWLRRTPAETRREVRFEVATPTTTDPTSLTVSPDGSRIVFVAMSQGRGQLWLRSIGTIATQPLPGTEDGVLPFWSPDSRSVGFFANGRLLRLDLDNGLIRPLTIAPNPLGGAWNRDGTILFAPNYTGPRSRSS
jgi:serine/threonine protein kinase